MINEVTARALTHTHTHTHTLAPTLSHARRHTHTHTQANTSIEIVSQQLTASPPTFRGSCALLRLRELNTHTRTGLFICLPFRILLRIIAINRFTLMRLSDARKLPVNAPRAIYWEIRWRFSQGGHNNVEEVSDEFSILENS